jgi:ubiquinone/menaquinone biosynthesis C-methylase UbiE
MSLAAMVLADRSERFMRSYDRWISLTTLGQADRAREEVLGRIRPGQRLLEVGCGTGTLAVAAAQRGATVVAFDRSEAMLELAKEKAHEAGVTVDWRQGEAAFPPIGDEQFDVVTATFVLSELSRDLAALAVRRMAEALRPGGQLLIADEVTPERPAARILVSIPRSILALLSFAVLEQFAPTRRHPWAALLREAGLEPNGTPTAQGASLAVFEARRPAELPPRHRVLLELDQVLPTGLRQALLKAAAWMDLPIAVRPGIYRIGDPGPDGPVLLTGNFLASVEAVRAGLAGHPAYLVIEDTDGWNVWCAGDAGLFNAEKAAALLDLHRLDALVSHRRIVVPRLGGRVRRRLTELTGWEVLVGPIEARDLVDFLEAGLTPAMRDLGRLYGTGERIRVGALTLVQLPLFLLPIRLIPPATRRPAWRLALLSSAVLPLAHDRLPGRTGVAKATYAGGLVAVAGLLTRRLRLGAAAVIVALAPLVGWVYQSSSPVVFWKRFWR